MLHTFADKKIVIRGKLSLDVIESVKYGKQVQIQVFSDTFKEESRFRSVGENRWNRSEIFFSFGDFMELLRLFGLEESVILNYIEQQLGKSAEERIAFLIKMNKLLSKQNFRIW